MKNKIEKSETLKGINYQGYGYTPKALNKNKNLDIYEKSILNYMLSYTGDGISCFPNILTIANDLNISKKTVITKIQILCKKKWLEKGQLNNSYRNKHAYILKFLDNDYYDKNLKSETITLLDNPKVKESNFPKVKELHFYKSVTDTLSFNNNSINNNINNNNIEKSNKQINNKNTSISEKDILNKSISYKQKENNKVDDNNKLIKDTNKKEKERKHSAEKKEKEITPQQRLINYYINLLQKNYDIILKPTNSDYANFTKGYNKYKNDINLEYMKNLIYTWIVHKVGDYFNYNIKMFFSKISEIQAEYKKKYSNNTINIKEFENIQKNKEIEIKKKQEQVKKEQQELLKKLKRKVKNG